MEEKCPDLVPLENVVVQGLYKASHFHSVNKYVLVSCLQWARHCSNYLGYRM